MRRSTVVALVALVLTALSTGAFAQEKAKFRAGVTDNGYGRYRVSVLLTEGEDRDRVIADLAAIYRARLEPIREIGFDGFVAAMSSAGARLLSRDARVAAVEEMPAANEPAEVAAVEGMTSGETSPATRTPVTNVGNDTWSTGTYSYDGSGNVRTIGTDTFVYDAFGRVTSGSAGTGHRQDYTYDRFGNILTMKTVVTGQPDINTDLGVTPANNRTSLGSYDAAGNMTSYQSIDTFAYDGLGMIKESKVEGVRNVYLYTPNDERIAAITVDTNTYAELRSRWTLRDASGKVLRRLAKEGAGTNATWAWVEDYVYRDGTLLAAEVPGSPRRLQFHLDHLGTPRLITGDGGAEVARHTYYAFGSEATSAVQDAEALKFTGHERDGHSLDYVHARYYNSEWGRFLSVDPVLDIEEAVRESQTWNRYAYARNNPLKYVDPDGKQAVPGQRYVTGQGWTTTSPLDPANRPTPQVAMQYMAVTGAILGGFLIRTIVDIASAPDVGPEEVPRPSVDTPKGTTGGDRAGKPFTPKGKQEIFDRNAQANGGTNKCEGCGTTVVPGQQSQKGVTPPGNERQADHIIPRSKGGDGSPSNGQTLCRDCNLDKRDKLPPP